MNKQAFRNPTYYPFYFFFVALLLYWPSFRVFFSLDDLQFLLRACGIEDYPVSFKRIISTRLFYQAGWNLFGPASQYYHFVILIIHTANAWLIYRISRRLGATDFAGISGALLFLLTPVAFTTIYWISGIQEVSMTFFALLATIFYLAPGRISIALCLAASVLSLLCKEASLLLLPALAIFVQGSPRRRLILGIGGTAIALVFLGTSGASVPRPPGDPYETAFGINIFLNALTYSAWLVRFWDYFPDRIPQYQTSLAAWGAILPAAFLFVMWRYRKARHQMLKALAIFLLFLAPVLPLIRHSYYYYMYLPLVPLWILAGISLDRIPGKRYAYILLAGFFIYSWATGILHRNSEIQEGVLSDPFLRYARISAQAVKEIRDLGEIRKGDYLFLRTNGGESVDLSKGLEGRTGTTRIKVHYFKQALLGGKGLRVFLPEIESVQFEDETVPVAGWENMNLFWTYGIADVVHLGYGREGRRYLIDECMKAGLYDRAKSEIVIMLKLDPNDAELLSLRNQIDSMAGR